MFTLLVILHVLASLVLILVVLLQSGKAGDLASAFGGAGTQTAFGARGAATVLSKATTVCAIVFMVTSLGLSITYLRGTKGSSVMEGVRTAPTTTAPKPANPAERSGGSPAQTAPQQQQQTPPPAQQPEKK
ncbi:MAG: preprotein translocase subunit SecG [Acidobacteriota bacterium]